MGSGKSLIGKLLARELGFVFYDLDRFIEQRCNQSITEIFRVKGEKYFRKKEAEALRSLPLDRQAVISCGGGTFCNFDNRVWIKEQGISIYLKVSPEVLAERLSTEAELRPLIAQNNTSRRHLEDFIVQHLASRKDSYESADIIFLAEGTPKAIISELVNYFHRYNQKG